MFNVLWADDQLDVVKSLSGCLNKDDYNIVYVDNGISAIESLKNSKFDIVLLDLSMPPGQWGGLWLLEELQEAAIKIPSIVISGEGAQTETIKAIRLGADDYVLKENLSDELPRQLESILAKNIVDQDCILTMISLGEGENLEFKSSLRFNLKSGLNDKRMELSVFKTISAFINTNGGKLLVGVDDNGTVLGIEHDGFENRDKFHLHFNNLLKNSLGIERANLVKAEFICVEGKTVFLVNCVKGSAPAFLKWNVEKKGLQELFYVRIGPQTEQLTPSETYSYIKDNF